MILDVAPLVRALDQLERQISELPNYTRALSAAVDRRGCADVLCATLDLERHLHAIRFTASQITARVIEIDRLDAPTSLSELALRAIRLAVLADLDVLRELALPRTSELWVHVLETVDALRAGIELTALLKHNAEADRPAYRAALRIGHAIRRALAEPTGPGQFLHEGQARGDLPDLQSVCARLLRTLRLQLDLDADAPLLLVRTLRMPDATPETLL
jgi:hypothetical protein